VSDLLRRFAGFIENAEVEAGYQKCCAAARGNTQLLVALELERKGGPCPLCGTRYAKMDMDNPFGKFTYFEPACYCYKRCDICGRHLVAERFQAIGHCTTCFPRGVEKARKDTSKHKKLDGKGAAAGEKNDT
jgi:hypothetical protein